MNTYIETIHCSNISHKQYVVFFVCFALKYHSTLCSYKKYFDFGTKSCTEYIWYFVTNKYNITCLSFFVFNVLFIIFVFNNCYRKEESDLQINYWHKIFLWTMMKFENPSKGIVAFIAVLHIIVIARPSIKCNNFVLQCTCLNLPLPVFAL